MTMGDSMHEQSGGDAAGSSLALEKVAIERFEY
jgi:hypothetical protein